MFYTQAFSSLLSNPLSSINPIFYVTLLREFRFSRFFIPLHFHEVKFKNL
jgi:hypothetical protein